MSEIFRGRIKEIVRGSDLSTLSSKKIREQLETEFKTDLNKRKKEIDDIVMGVLVSELKSEKTQDASGDDDSEDDISDTEPPKKKKKKSHKKDKSSKKTENDKTKKSKPNNTPDNDLDSTNNDEELARKLQDESSMKTRHSRAKTSKKKETKKGSASSKDSGYKKEMVLSPKLAAILGSDRMSRQDVVRKMWQVIKERNLSDPKNKQYHICDDELFAVFGIRRVKTFSMMKYLKMHVKDPSLLVDSLTF